LKRPSEVVAYVDVGGEPSGQEGADLHHGVETVQLIFEVPLTEENSTILQEGQNRFGRFARSKSGTSVHWSPPAGRLNPVIFFLATPDHTAMAPDTLAVLVV